MERFACIARVRSEDRVAKPSIIAACDQRGQAEIALVAVIHRSPRRGVEIQGIPEVGGVCGKLIDLFADAESIVDRLSSERVCSFVGDGKVVHGESKKIGKLYREYLKKKFETQATEPKWTRRSKPRGYN